MIDVKTTVHKFKKKKNSKWFSSQMTFSIASN